MPRIDLDLSIDIERTPRAAQLEGMFDVPEAKKQTVSFHFEAPFDERDWQIGLIVGPSGAGKSSVARYLFGDSIVAGYDWHPSRSLVDSFDKAHSIRDITAALSSVGFSSPPSWLKPFRVLSNGEQFRANLARAIMDERELIAIDEFTSVIDRTVAQIGCAATAKSIRRHPSKKFVAISCHDDIVDWLCPDWILEPHVGRFTWGLQRRRPPIELEIRRVRHSTWSLFAPHHYLTSELATAARCFGAFWRGRIVAFVAWLPFVGRLSGTKQAKRVHRTVVLPDYQGVGIGRAIVDVTAAAWSALEFRGFLSTSHPGEIASRVAHGNWLLTRHGFTGRDGGRADLSRSRAIDRRTASLEWIGPPLEVAAAKELIA